MDKEIIIKIKKGQKMKFVAKLSVWILLLIIQEKKI